MEQKKSWFSLRVGAKKGSCCNVEIEEISEDGAEEKLDGACCSEPDSVGTEDSKKE